LATASDFEMDLQMLVGFAALDADFFPPFVTRLVE
jgi:hypothetical protein